MNDVTAEPSYRDGDDGPMDEEEGGHDVPQTSPSQRFKYGMSKDGTRTPPRYDQDGGKAAHGTPRQLRYVVLSVRAIRL